MKTFYKFFKYQGAGNDFLLFEDFEEEFPFSEVKQICDRRLGVGADGLILARKSKEADFEMVFFNCDGSRGAMCGNGLRCFVHFLRDLGFLQQSYSIEVGNQFLTVKMNGSKILTYLVQKEVLGWRIPFENREVFAVDTGAGHAVVFAEEGVDVVTEGMRLSQVLGARGPRLNVNFARRVDEDVFALRTFELGVEGETLACGTGAAAVAFVANQLGIAGNRIQIKTRSGEILSVRLGEEIEVMGPSKKVFEGQLEIESCTAFQKEI